MCFVNCPTIWKESVGIGGLPQWRSPDTRVWTLVPRGEVFSNGMAELHNLSSGEMLSTRHWGTAAHTQRHARTHIHLLNKYEFVWTVFCPIFECIQMVTCSINAGTGLTRGFFNSSWDRIDMDNACWLGGQIQYLVQYVHVKQLYRTEVTTFSKMTTPPLNLHQSSQSTFLSKTSIYY